MEKQQSDIRHRLEYEIYYHLGLNRNCAKLARLQLPRLYPDIPTDSTEWTTKFNSLYTKYKRWCLQEHWDSKCQKRGDEEKSQRDKVVQKEAQTLTETVQMYRTMIRFMLQKFAEEVSQGKHKIKDPDQAKRIIDLDMYLTQVLEKRPRFLPAAVWDMMSEEDRRHMDKVFEFLRKRVHTSESIEDLGEIVDAEAQAKVIQLIPPPKQVEAEVIQDEEKTSSNIPEFLRPLKEHRGGIDK